jgi:hypothetical protein
VSAGGGATNCQDLPPQLAAHPVSLQSCGLGKPTCEPSTWSRPVKLVDLRSAMPALTRSERATPGLPERGTKQGPRAPAHEAAVPDPAPRHVADAADVDVVEHVNESERRKDLRQLKGLVVAHRLAGVGEQRRERL